MDRPVELVPLVCIKCSTPIPAQPDEIAWVCSQCKQGLLLDEQKGLVPLEVHYAAAVTQEKGKPFWVAEGRVSLQRATYKGNEDRDAQLFWSQPRRFFIPAFDCPLETLLNLGTNLLFQPPTLQPGNVVLFEPVTLSLPDIHALAEFVVMAIEANRKDKLKEIRIGLELSEPSLWVLP